MKFVDKESLHEGEYRFPFTKGPSVKVIKLKKKTCKFIMAKNFGDSISEGETLLLEQNLEQMILAKLIPFEEEIERPLLTFEFEESDLARIKRLTGKDYSSVDINRALEESNWGNDWGEYLQSRPSGKLNDSDFQSIIEKLE